ncbi:carnitine 3-dehydrogenase [Paracoccus alcaliphilus]|uniref:L-carnitine dehydrogenase n=1 Tax=Paracoccus alcaliphilus TaxID=34002 RepID=A0A1H8G2Y5_9RHOB|nr:carnitine 3-dehydrogenase [Paracoccus alcaliphilus]WCR20325.1 carnitine 3-dehydrogenase [Paracoccus alcaliphilus]SEN38115.1 carnitine 3-dehydrogenase [Paracoccus alcaliphilus]
MNGTIAKAACIGGGVIGAGWVARLILHGVDVDVHDPSPDAERVVAEVLANARRSMPRLLDASLPVPGRLRFAASIADAVAGAGLVQESVPERLELKRAVLTAIDAAAPVDAIIGSSTSGLLPSDLQQGMAHPERLVVAHPYNPVYLLPLVELVGGQATTPDSLTRAQAIYTALGMKPVTIRREIEAFVGDRLLEALWREALWLVHDGIASVTEIDDVIRYSFGLRWAQMGLFQTYRIAGGEAGMRHFLHQFGPALKWPWTRLMDVPDLDEALVARIADQSDEQAAGLSVRELERIRDDNLVAIMRALAAQQGGRGWGAGELLRQQEAAMRSDTQAEPLRLLSGTVPTEWIDYNGHMTEHRYLEVFGNTTDALLAQIGVDAGYVASGRSYYTVETHIMHLGEARQGAPYDTTTQILHADDKRLHVFHQIRNSDTGAILASAEQMLLHVDARAQKAVAAAPDLIARVAALAQAHAHMPRPPAMGRHVGQRPG